MKNKELILPGVLKLNDLFNGFYLCPEVITPGHGSSSISPKGTYYFSFSVGRPCIKNIHKKTFYVYAEPTKELAELTSNCCCDGKIGCFLIAPGPDSLFILRARDKHMIANPAITYIDESDALALVGRIDAAEATLNMLSPSYPALNNYFEIT